MGRALGTAAVGLVLLTAGQAGAGNNEHCWPAGPGEPPGEAAGAAGFSQAAVERAVRRAAGYLWKARNADGSWSSGHNGAYPTGATALAACALLTAGADRDRRGEMQATLGWLARTQDAKTYSLGLRCNVWHLADRRDPAGPWKAQLRKDAGLLIGHTAAGASSYPATDDGLKRWDNSNTQYAVLGAWAAMMATGEVPARYWRLVWEHWKACQSRDGGWGYEKGGKSTATMTAGGVASMLVCFECLHADQFVHCRARVANRPVEAAMEWMDRNFAAALAGGGGLLGHGDLHYFLYGVERVGLASGQKYFGAQDWYKLGAGRLLAAQKPDGSWSGKFGPVASTSFALLFLARGQQAVAFNKLQHDGDWNNRPRDLAGLTRWLNRDRVTLEKDLHWQVVNFQVPVEEWHDAPILYVSGCRDPNFTDEQLDRLRTFVWQGGTIFSTAQCGGRAFSAAMRAACAKLFPACPLRRLPRGHVLFTLAGPMPAPPAVEEASNGIRPLLLHSDEDLSLAWQQQLKRIEAPRFQIADCVVRYVTDMGRLRPRGAAHWPADPRATGPSVRLVRVRHAGNWDPEPLAYERFARLLGAEAGVRLEVAAPVEMGQLASCDAKLAAMTGTEAFAAGPAEHEQIKRFCSGGGTLVIDAAGGSREFADSAEALLRAVFGRTAVSRLSSQAELYRAAGFGVEPAEYRRQARIVLGRKHGPDLRGVVVGGRVAVVFSKEDITGGLVGCECYSSVGYAPAAAYALMRNCVFHAAGVRPAAAGAKPAGAARN